MVIISIPKKQDATLIASYANSEGDRLVERDEVSHDTTFRDGAERAGIFLQMADKVLIEQNAFDIAAAKDV